MGKLSPFSLFAVCADFLSQTLLGWEVTVAVWANRQQ